MADCGPSLWTQRRGSGVDADGQEPAVVAVVLVWILSAHFKGVVQHESVSAATVNRRNAIRCSCREWNAKCGSPDGVTDFIISLI